MRNRNSKRVCAFLAMAALGGTAHALGLPGGLGGVPLPNPGSLVGGVRNDLGDTFGTVNAVRRDLVGRPVVRSSTFDSDDHGARVVRHEVLAIAPRAESLNAAKAQGFEIVRNDTLSALGLAVVVLRSPSGMSASAAVKALRASDPAGTYEFDHIYDPSGETVGNTAAHAAPALSFGRIGIVDGGIDLKHSAFEGANILTFNAASKANVPTAHGTAVASLLVGSHERWRGAAREARLFAADVFGGQPDGGSAAAIARGLAWLAENNVAVINVSLSGPKNALVGAAIRALIARGHIVVAAVGNDGPAVGVSYPAAYDGVVAVTSVDGSGKIQLDANRGPEVMFSAPGVEVPAAKPGSGFARMTGTSFAAPIVAANFAALLARPDVKAASAARARLESLALDLGAPGRDPVYGFGELEAPGPVAESLVR
jgi:hypothetical protein